MFIGDDLCLKKSFNDFTNLYFFIRVIILLNLEKKWFYIDILSSEGIFGPNRTGHALGPHWFGRNWWILDQTC